MARQLQVGDSVPIPCRHCLRPIPFAVAEGIRRVTCPVCAQQTEVTVEIQAGRPLVFTSRVSAYRSPAAKEEE